MPLNSVLCGPERSEVSFDIFLSHFANGDLAEAAKAPILEVLNRREYKGPDEFGFYVVDMGPDDQVEVSASGLESADVFYGCAFHVRRLSEALSRFIFDVAVAGQLAVIPAMEGNPVLVLEPSMLQELPSEMREGFVPAVVLTADELHAAIAPGFRDWADYRDQVVGR